MTRDSCHTHSLHEPPVLRRPRPCGAVAWLVREPARRLPLRRACSERSESVTTGRAKSACSSVGGSDVPRNKNRQTTVSGRASGGQRPRRTWNRAVSAQGRASQKTLNSAARATIGEIHAVRVSACLQIHSCAYVRERACLCVRACACKLVPACQRVRTCLCVCVCARLEAPVCAR
eukprot:6190037-Pleurochrysis_carterae.AAC.1